MFRSPRGKPLVIVSIKLVFDGPGAGLQQVMHQPRGLRPAVPPRAAKHIGGPRAHHVRAVGQGAAHPQFAVVVAAELREQGGHETVADAEEGGRRGVGGADE